MSNVDDYCSVEHLTRLISTILKSFLFSITIQSWPIFISVPFILLYIFGLRLSEGRNMSEWLFRVIYCHHHYDNKAWLSANFVSDSFMVSAASPKLSCHFLSYIKMILHKVMDDFKSWKLKSWFMNGRVDFLEDSSFACPQRNHSMPTQKRTVQCGLQNAGRRTFYTVNQGSSSHRVTEGWVGADLTEFEPH